MYLINLEHSLRATLNEKLNLFEREMGEEHCEEMFSAMRERLQSTFQLAKNSMPKMAQKNIDFLTEKFQTRLHSEKFDALRICINTILPKEYDIETVVDTYMALLMVMKDFIITDYR